MKNSSLIFQKTFLLCLFQRENDYLTKQKNKQTSLLDWFQVFSNFIHIGIFPPVLVTDVSALSIIHVCWGLFPSRWCQFFQLRGAERHSGIKPATGDSDPAGYWLQTDLWMDDGRGNVWKVTWAEPLDGRRIVLRDWLPDMSWTWSRLTDLRLNLV